MGICFIFAGVTVSWMILGITVEHRTSSMDHELKTAVGQLWGAAVTQYAPTAHYFVEKKVQETERRDNQETLITKTVRQRHEEPLDGSDIHVNLQLEHRRKGLLWYATYRVRFNGIYRFENESPQDKTIHFEFTFPATMAIYDDFVLRITDLDGEREIKNLEMHESMVRHTLRLPPGGTALAEVGYLSRGLDEWRYSFGQNVSQIKDFSLIMHTDFAAIDFPEESISPSEKITRGQGWELIWNFTNLITGATIALEMPRKLNPGPWVSSIIFFAPVPLFFFFFTMLVFTTLQKVNVHPMNYLFVACAFFSFHLLLAYLVDHISIHLAFWISAAVSIFLVISYMRLVVGPRFAFVAVGLSQFVYLVVFSYTFFFKGYTGLSVTIMSIITLFVVMQASGKVDWEEVFAKKPRIPEYSETDSGNDGDFRMS